MEENEIDYRQSFKDLDCGPCIAVITDENQSVWELLQDKGNQKNGHETRIPMVFSSPYETELYLKSKFQPLFEGADGKPPLKKLRAILFPVCPGHRIESLYKLGLLITWRNTPCLNSTKCKGRKSRDSSIK